MLPKPPRLVLHLLVLASASCADEGEPSAIADATSDASVPSDAAEAIDIDASSPEPKLDADQPTLDAHTVDAAELDEMPLDATRDACVSDAGAPPLSPAVVEHACLHGSDGPFRVVTGGGTPEMAPDVSRPHTLFTVLGQAGATLYLRYLPDASGDYVIFVARAELVMAQQGASSILPERAPADCGVLPTSYVLPLPSDEPLELALRAERESFAVVLESLATWGSDAWACMAQPAVDAGACRKSGPCSSDAECCSFCHDYDHCH